ncbi:MAG TPA: MMPL family transporter [Acidimicrobiales bacterium]|nr:MMPL family transporter [Acidimicrobiales bacterium]
MRKTPGGALRRWWEWLGLNLGKRAGTVAMVGLLVTLVFGVGVTKLRFSTSNSDYLNTNDPAWIDNVNYSKVFGGDPMAVLFTMKPGMTVDNLFTPANQREFKIAAAKLAKDPWVFSAVTPLDAMQFGSVLLQSSTGSPLNSPAGQLLSNAVKRDPSAASRRIRSAYLIKEGELLTHFAPSQQVLSNPQWVSFVVHEPNGAVRESLGTFVPNNIHALMAVYLIGNLNINQETTAATSVQNIINSVHFQNVTLITTGVPELLKTINDYLKHGILVLAGIAAIVMVTILALSFTVRWRLLAFAIVAIGMVWGFGLVGYFGVPLTLATITALPVLLGVGMDYAIQMHSRIEEEVVLDRAAHPIQAAARGLGPALLVVTFDAVFAFTALWFAATPAIRQFGSLLVIGIVAVCVCSIIATLAVLGIREYKSPTKGKDFSQGRLSRVVVFLGSLPRKSAIPLAMASIVIFLGGIAVEGKLVLQTDPIQWINPQAQSTKNLEALKAGTGSDNELAANVTSNQPFSDQTVKYVATFSRALQAEYPTGLWPGAGLVNTIDQFITNLPGETEVPPTGAQIQGIYLIAPQGIRKTTVADGGRSLNVIFRGKTDTLSQLTPVVDKLQSGEHPPPGIHVAPGGIAVVGVGLVQNLEKTRVLLTYLALIFVGAFLAVRLRSLIRSLLSLVPVLVAVGSVSLIAVALGLKLSPVTAVAGPLVVAVCTEFTSLILLRFVEERARGLEPRAAMDATARRTGRAFMVSGMTAIAGVAVLGTSSFPLLRDFGIIVALNVTVALVSALVVLPPILVWADERGWVSRSLIRRREEAHPELDGAPAHRPEPQRVPGNGPEPQPQPQPVAHQGPQAQPEPQPVAHQGPQSQPEPQPVAGRVDLWRSPITPIGDGHPT